MADNEFTFTDSPAARIPTPLLMGLVGPSGTGKTYSALRLATGIQRVTGGEIFGIDTESSRMLHYAPLTGEKPDPARGKFAFRHVPFGAPYGSLRYLAAIQYCVSRGAKIIVIDSTSHEHDGVGGMLEQHQAEAERLAKEWKTTVDAAKMSAWGPPKAARKKLINTILTDLKVNVIFCFRAKQKIKVATKEEKKAGVEAVTPLGYMPIAGDDFIFELTCKCVLLPGARGVPTWESPYQGEQEMMKIPDQFMHIFDKSAPLSEDIGQQLAEWAAGGDVKVPSDEELAECLKRAKDAKTHDAIDAAAESFRGRPWTREQRAKLQAALKASAKALESAA